MDKALDKVATGIGSIFKKKDKNEKGNEATSAGGTGSADASTSSSPSSQTKSSASFDFVAGEKVLFFDNFERLASGDFPAEYNTNASGEVVTIEGKQGKWLNMTKNGAFIPDRIKKLPENFTLEFEVGINTDPTNNYPGFGLNFTTEPDDLMKERFFSKGTSALFLHPGAAEITLSIIPVNGSEITNEIKMPQWNATKGLNFVKVSVWRQNGRLRLYVNQDKMVDLPRFFTENKNYDFAFIRSFFEQCNVYLTNIRYAIAGADTRSKLISEGKFVTTGITFDTNSDSIKPESGAVLKEIAAALQENPSVRIKIIGHTDSDGADAANLTLSQKRAEAVRKALFSFYGIEVSRMETAGKGESDPTDSNGTAAGKANNRRVEFIKL
ncbi:MAG: OmpA family protein [Bacteroidia bacterium]